MMEMKLSKGLQFKIQKLLTWKFNIIEVDWELVSVFELVVSATRVSLLVIYDGYGSEVLVINV